MDTICYNMRGGIEQMTRQLVQALKDRQQNEGLTQQGMAAKLGISQSTLSRLYAGKRDLGIESLEQIIRAYPELSGFFLAEHMQSGKAISGEATATQKLPQPHGDG
jgi:transcriptional regulator with XRE-family HTH domain